MPAHDGFHPRQMRRQRYALRYLSGAAHGRKLQRIKLGFHRRDVGFDGVLEQSALLGIDRLRAGRELDPAQARDFRGERVDLGQFVVAFAEIRLNLGLTRFDDLKGQTARRFMPCAGR